MSSTNEAAVPAASDPWPFGTEAARALDGQALHRRGNLRRALQAVIDGEGSASRAGIARRTGLTSATVSSLVAELIELGVVVEGEPAESTGGKRATMLDVDRARHLLLVVVAHVHDAAVGVLSLGGDVLAERRADIDPADPDGAIATIVALVDDATASVRGDVLAACTQVPGVTDGHTVIESVQFGWRDIPLADILGAKLGVPTVLLNDVDAEAIAESAGAAGALQLFVHLGAGIGAAVSTGGALVAGAHSRAGEIGHVRVVFDSGASLCRCGLRGCLESAASMPAMLGAGFDDAITPEEVALLARAHGTHTQLGRGARALARALLMMSALLDPAEIVIGGPARALGPDFISTLRDEFEIYHAKGTSATIPIRYAAADRGPFFGPAQHLLAVTMGVQWHRGAAATAATPPAAATARG